MARPASSLFRLAGSESLVELGLRSVSHKPLSLSGRFSSQRGREAVGYGHRTEEGSYPSPG